MLALLAAGCGNSTTGPVEQARDTAATLLESCARESPNAVAGLLTSATRQTFIAAPSTADGCLRVLKLSGPRDREEFKSAFGNGKVGQASVRGGFAAVDVVTGAGEETSIELEDVRGDWYVGG